MRSRVPWLKTLRRRSGHLGDANLPNKYESYAGHARWTNVCLREIMVQSTGSRSVRRNKVQLCFALLLSLGACAVGCASETSVGDSEDSLSQGGGTVDRTVRQGRRTSSQTGRGKKETEVRIDPLGQSIQFAITRKGDNAWLRSTRPISAVRSSRTMGPPSKLRAFL